MFIKILNDVITYPYSESDLKQEYPNTSFPNPIDNESINHLGIFKVIAKPRPNCDTLFHKVIEHLPFFDESIESWVQKWDVVKLNEDEIQLIVDSALLEVSNKRSTLLQSCDWTQLEDVPVEIKQKWKAYRQELRDITLQDGYPSNVIWPQIPN
jgi:hypothetical protein